MILRAKAKYEIGQTVLFFPRLRRDEFEWISNGNLFEYWWKTDDSGEFDGKLMEGFIKRNKVRATEIHKKGDGYYVYTDLDVNCLTLR
jgi:hypothetical protein